MSFCDDPACKHHSFGIYAKNEANNSSLFKVGIEVEDGFGCKFCEKPSIILCGIKQTIESILIPYKVLRTVHTFNDDSGVHTRNIIINIEWIDIAGLTLRAFFSQLKNDKK